MSNFFSLGGGGGEEGGKDQGHPHHNHHHHQHQQQDSSLYLFKNEEIYNKGFEQWQQYYQLQQLRSAQDVNFSVGPSNRSIISSSSGDDHNNTNRSSSNFRVMRHGSSSSGSGNINCQDCGNQAKKDCPHLRCRTCCKSRGFHCDTHVKSTWVPAAKRRERLQQQQQLVSLQHQQNQNQNQNQTQNQLTLRGGDNENYPPKRPRETNITTRGADSSSPLPCTRLTTSSSGLEVGGHFPAEVNSPAVFRCVRVSSAVDDAEEQYAYQTAVNIGGHVFKGILYDQGHYSGGGEGSSTGGDGVHNHQQQPLNLITAATSSSATTSAMAANLGFTMLDPSVYPTPLSAFMSGSPFFQPPRP